jgi:hypothetical protein
MPTLTLCALLFAALQADPPKGSVEEAIAAALRHHPDVKVAEANRILAEAELEQTKLAVSKRVSAAYAKMEAAKLKYEARALLEQRLKNVERLTPEVLQHAATLADVKAEMVLVNEELKAALGAANAPAAVAEGVAAALKNNPDIKVAEAKRLVAEATADQAKLAVTQRVAPTFAKIQAARANVQAAEVDSMRLGNLRNTISQAEIERAETRLLVAKAELAVVEAEWKAITGGGAKTDTEAAQKATVERGISFLATMQQIPSIPTGSAADKLRALIDKPIKLDIKAGPFSDIMPEFIKQAGLQGITVRYPTWASVKILKEPPTVGPITGEKTLTAWVELLLDQFNNPNEPVNIPESLNYSPPCVAVVREYGLLFVGKNSAPSDSITLSEFAKLVRAEKVRKTEPKK